MPVSGNLMRRISSFTILLSVSLVVSPGFGPFLVAQTALPGPQGTSCWPQARSNPDSLLAQITTAATNPQEILDVDNWLQDNQGQTRTALIDAAQQQGFDPAFIGLVNFPQVLEMMAQHVDDYAAIGLSAAAPVIVRGRSCGPTVRAIAAIGAIGREIVPVATGRHINHPELVQRAGLRLNQLGRRPQTQPRERHESRPEPTLHEGQREQRH
jgi:hypothetical protein